MDSLINAAAQALAQGDPLGALNRVALRGDAAALALRGIAMAQMGDLERARMLVRQAARAFGPTEAVAKARCVVAEAEIALAARELAWPTKALAAAAATLETHHDRANAAHARQLEARQLLLIGRLDEAEGKLSQLDPADLSPALRAVHELAVAGISMRRVRAGAAQAALERAEEAARWAGIPALAAEIDQTFGLLAAPTARLIERGKARPLLLAEVEALLASDALVIDACRNIVRTGGRLVPLASRPVLFALARALAEAWPSDLPRDVLLARAFGARHADESHRARLRVEMGRLRKLLGGLAHVNATRPGYAMVAAGSREVVVLARPIEEEHSNVLALLADGESWSSSALALALGASQRSVQRALVELVEANKVEAFGRGPARRWMIPSLPGFATTLLLPAPLPGS